MKWMLPVVGIVVVAVAVAMQIEAGPVEMQVRFEEELTDGVGGEPWVGTRWVKSIAADGSVSEMHQQYTRDGKLAMTVRELKLVGGVKADVYDSLKAVTAYRAPNAAAEDRNRQREKWNPKEGCTVTYNKANRREGAVRREMMLGYEVLVFESFSGKVRFTNWVAPALGCYELRRLAEFLEYKTTSDLRAVEVKVGAPPKAVFEIPAEYEHVKPSEMLRREVAYRGGGPVEPAVWKQMEDADAYYAQFGFSGKP